MVTLLASMSIGTFVPTSKTSVITGWRPILTCISVPVKAYWLALREPDVPLSIQVMAGVGPPLFGAERTELILYSLPVTLVHEALETAVAPRSWGLAPKPSHL